MTKLITPITGNAGLSEENTDPLLTTPEAASVLGTSPQTLEVWRCTKRYPLAYVKIGRSVRYRKSALLAFIASRTVGADAA
jgi:excisionase family DNA binding protein